MKNGKNPERNQVIFNQGVIFIGRRIKESTGEKRATSYLMQTIGIAIQRGNSQCILSTVKDSRKMDEVYYL